MLRKEAESAWTRVFENHYLTLIQRGLPFKTAIVTAREAADTFAGELAAKVEAARKERAKAFVGNGAAELTPDGMALLDLYHSHSTLQRVPEPIAPVMVKRINAGAKQGIEAWRARFAIIRRSDHLMGRSSKFQATLAWLLQVRVQEDIDSGKYV